MSIANYLFVPLVRRDGSIQSPPVVLSPVSMLWVATLDVSLNIPLLGGDNLVTIVNLILNPTVNLTR